MALNVRVYILAGLAGLLVMGVAIGAESQEETFLHPDALKDVGLGDAAGNLVALTALVPAIAVAASGALLSRVPWVRRLAPTVSLFLATYFLVALIQSSWPNYDVVAEARSASFSITPLISNGDAVSSVFLAPIGVVLAAGMVMQRAFATLMPRESQLLRPRQALARFMAAYLLAVPFLIVLGLGSLRLLFALPDGASSTVPYLLVFPVSALACFALMATGGVKLWQLGAFTRNGRLADSATDLWASLRKPEWGLVGLLVGVGFLATFLEAVQSPLLEAGRTFGVSARGHTQAQALMLIPLAAWLGLDRAVQTSIEGHRDRRPTLEVGPGASVIGAFVTVGVALVAGALATWLAPGALWTWAVVLAPIVIFAWSRHPRSGWWPSVMLAVVLWGIGNTVTGVFRLTEDADNALTLDVSPGVLSMFRVLAVLVLATAAARLVRRDAESLRKGWAFPAALLVATAAAFLIFLEASFTAWIAPRSQGEFVGIGSLVASQDRPVRAAIHLIVALPAIASGFALARIHRPDWFHPPKSPAAMTVAAGSKRPSTPPGESAT